MTATNHLQSDRYVTAYRAELASDLRAAHSTVGRTRKIRGALARTMVRAGVSLMPEGPSLVDGRILVLPQPIADADLPKAA